MSTSPFPSSPRPTPAVLCLWVSPLASPWACVIHRSGIGMGCVPSIWSGLVFKPRPSPGQRLRWDLPAFPGPSGAGSSRQTLPLPGLRRYTMFHLSVMPLVVGLALHGSSELQHCTAQIHSPFAFLPHLCESHHFKRPRSQSINHRPFAIWAGT